MVGWIKMKLGTKVGGLGPGHIVLHEDPAPPPPKGHSPQFSAHICCGQMAGWIKMALGMEVGLGPGYIVLDGDPAPLPKKGQSLTQFSDHLLWPYGCMYPGTIWYGGRPRPRRHCVRWGPSSRSPKGAQPPIFGQYSLCIVAIWLDGLRCHFVWR